MQAMDCRNFKELLDSYLCGELAVETNHAILRHAELCGVCRDEMAARRTFRESLRRACSRERMSDQAVESLRARLRAEAGLKEGEEETNERANERGWLARLFETRLLLPMAATAALLLLTAGVWSLYLLSGKPQTAPAPSPEMIKALELSDDLIVESVGDHQNCASHFIAATGPAEMPDSVRDYDPACLRLDKVAAEGARDLRLRAAHVCGYGGRRFAHLVYTHGERLISLLVTERDGRALKLGAVPPFDGLSIGLQQAEHERIALGAYQTNQRIVLVVSDLPENENKTLAERLAKPVVEHLRNAELPRTALNQVGRLRGRGR
jgi:hypothetical protein